MGGGGSREEEARNPPPGNSSARRRSEALLSLGDRGRPSAAPARPGEARGESGGRRPAPRPPAAAESPGPAGAGRGGAWERPAGGGGLGARRRAAADRPRAGRAGRAAGGPPAPSGSTRPASSGACLLCFPPRPRGRSARGRVESPARRGLPPFPPPQATPPGAGAGPEGARGGRPAGAGAEGPRPRVRSEGGPGEGGKGTKAGGGRRGPAGRPWRRGASRPLMNINRACGLARPGRARRPPASPLCSPPRLGSRAGRAAKGKPLGLGVSPGSPDTFREVHIWAALPGRSRSPTRLWKGRRK